MQSIVLILFCQTRFKLEFEEPDTVNSSRKPYSNPLIKWVDEDGQIHFSDQKPENHVVTEIEVEIGSYQSVSYDAFEVDRSISAAGAKVVILSASWCGSCKKAKKYFRKNRIRYTDYDIEKSSRGKRLFEKMGATGVPVIIVGDKRMNGFSESGFERLIR